MSTSSNSSFFLGWLRSMARLCQSLRHWALTASAQHLVVLMQDSLLKLTCAIPHSVELVPYGNLIIYVEAAQKCSSAGYYHNELMFPSWSSSQSSSSSHHPHHCHLYRKYKHKWSGCLFDNLVCAEDELCSDGKSSPHHDSIQYDEVWYDDVQ